MKLNNLTHNNRKQYPSRILQFGEGNFLRAFADWMVHKMNQQTDFNSGIDVVQPLPSGMVNMLNEQDGLYHVCFKRD